MSDQQVNAEAEQRVGIVWELVVSLDTLVLGDDAEIAVPFCESGHYEPGDEHAPFFTEAYLYNLIGKKAARSVLARWNRLRQALAAAEADARSQGRPSDE